MKKTLLCLFIISLLLSLAYSYAERLDPMDELIDRDEVLKVYVADVKNSSGNNTVNAENIKFILEKTLSERPPRKFDFSGKTINRKFEIVESASLADVVVNSMVIEYLWTDDDPIDIIIGVYAVAYDALTKENYARMQVVFSINDTKSGVLLWEDKIVATITDKNMSEEDSYTQMEERIVKIFMREIFEKTHPSKA